MLKSRLAISVAALSTLLAAGAASATDRGERAMRPQRTAVVMPLGGAAPAPAGFLDFCRRSPGECADNRAGRADLVAVENRAGQLYWAGVFGVARASAPAALGRGDLGRGPPARVNWNAVFRTAPVTASPPAARVAEPVRTAAATPSPSRPPRSRIEASPSANAATAPVVRLPVYSPPVVRALASSGKPAALPALMTPAVSAPEPGAQGAIDVTAVLMAAKMMSEAHASAARSAPTPVAVAEVASAAVQPAVLSMDSARWALVNDVNRRVNRDIRRGSDVGAFGVADLWQIPVAGGRGDCEDYVLSKRRALIAAGLPASALSIAIVTTRWGESHAVLLLASDEGEFVLDNLTPWISRWDRVDYVWHERQRPGQVFEWVRAAS